MKNMHVNEKVRVWINAAGRVLEKIREEKKIWSLPGSTNDLGDGKNR
jgi:hypothetical protein